MLDVLLLEVVLARAFGLAARKRTFVIPFASMNAGVPRQVARRAEPTLAHGADVVLFRGRRRRFGPCATLGGCH
jgi:hypothetical protein